MQLDILTPLQTVFSGEVQSVQVPGSKERGSFQILDKHAPMISSLQAGKVTVRSGNDTRVFFIKEGFVEVMEGRVAVLVEEAEEATEKEAR